MVCYHVKMAWGQFPIFTINCHYNLKAFLTTFEINVVKSKRFSLKLKSSQASFPKHNIPHEQAFSNSGQVNLSLRYTDTRTKIDRERERDISMHFVLCLASNLEDSAFSFQIRTLIYSIEPLAELQGMTG